MATLIHHYTNIDVLALILKFRTLRFTRLDQVDDPEEGVFISNGVNLGPYTFVSCWTEMKEESIPMWKMYTKDNYGIRLSFIKEGLFQTYTDGDDFRHNGLISTNLGAPICFLFPSDVRWKQTKYMPPFLTPDYDKCKFYRKIQYVDDVKKYSEGSFQITPNTDGKVCMSVRTDMVGGYKSKRWEFQEESRFVLNFMPGNPTAAFNTQQFDMEQSRMIHDLLQNKDLGFSFYDMRLSDDAFNNLVITLSPLCDTPQRLIVEALRDKYAPKAMVVESNLKGKLAR